MCSWLVACCSFVDDLVAFPRWWTVKRSKKRKNYECYPLFDCQSMEFLKQKKTSKNTNLKINHCSHSKRLCSVKGPHWISYRPKKKKRHLDNLCAEKGQGGPTRALNQSKSVFFGVNWFRIIHLQRVEKYRSQTTIRMILIEQIQVFATVLLGYKRKEKPNTYK